MRLEELEPRWVPNTAPVAVADSYSTHHGTTLTVNAASGLLANDTDADSDPLSVPLTSVTTPDHGSVGVNNDGAFVYIPNSGYVGSDSFQYRANDGTVDGNLATVTITVTNTAPSASGNSYTVTESPLNVSAPGVLGNDSDANGDTLTAVLVSDVSAGTLNLSSNGSFSYSPGMYFTGSDYFTYKASDGAAYSSIVTVTLTNNAPTAGGVSTSTNEDTAKTITLSGSDVETVELSFAIVAGPSNGTLSSLSNNSGSSGSPNTDSATVVYTPHTNFFGTDSFTYKVGDGVMSSSTVTVHITVNAVNDVPSFTEGIDQTVYEDAGAQSVNPWASALSTGAANESQALNFLVSNNNNALFATQPAISASGALTYTPAANAHGSATVTVQIHDDGGTANGGVDTSAAETFTITVYSVNDVPTASDFSTSTNEDTPKSITLYGSDVETTELTFTIVSGPSSGTLGTLTNHTGSSGTPNTDTATLVYTPAADYYGTDSFTYQVHDGTDYSSTVTVSLTINAVNDVPMFTKGGNHTVNEDAGAQTATGWATSVLSGPLNETSQTLTFLVSNNNTALFSAQPAISATGTLTYTPTANAHGSATVTVQLQDNGGTANGGVDTSAAQTFTITVNPVNDAPSFTKGGNQTVNEDAPAQSVSGWATALSKGPANESSQALDFLVSNNNTALFATQPAISATGTLTYKPAANAHGTATVTVQIHDDGGTANGGVDTSAAQTFTITVVSVNDPPIARDDPDGVTHAWWAFDEGDGTTTAEHRGESIAELPDGVSWSADVPAVFAGGSSLEFSGAAGPLEADSGLNGAELTVSFWVKWGAVGDTVLLQQEGWLLELTDGQLQVSVANDTETATVLDYSWGASSGQWYHVAVTHEGNEWLLYVDGAEAASATSNVAPADGSGSALAFGSATFVGLLDDLRLFSGALTGGQVEDVAAGDYEPVAPFAVNEDHLLTIGVGTVLANDSDADGDQLTVVDYGDPLHGVLSFDGALFVYEPDLDYHGPDRFTYTISDGNGARSTATVFLDVASINDWPVAEDDAESVAKNGVCAIDVLFNDADPEGDALRITSVSAPGHGTTEIDDNDTPSDPTDDFIVYIPTTDYVGLDEFTYTNIDGNGGSDTATVFLAVCDGQWATTVLGCSSEWAYGPYNWLAIQALGTPNTFEYGIQETAWSAQTLNNTMEWIAVGFDIPATATGVLIRETYGNGFVTQVDLLDVGDIWHLAVWTGTDSSPRGVPVDFIAPFSETSYLVKGARIIIDTGASPHNPNPWDDIDSRDTWEEIDAIKLLCLVIPDANEAPEAAYDSATVDEDSSVRVNVLGNDEDPDDDPLVISITTLASHGFAQIDFNETPGNPTDDAIIYHPDENFSGTDSFSYTLTDIFGATATATVTVTVNAVNDAPVLLKESTHLNAVVNVPESIDVLANAWDLEGDTLSITIKEDGQLGTASVSSNVVIYTPDLNAVGSDSFTYTLDDGNGGTVDGTVFITIYGAGLWAASVMEVSSQFAEDDWSAFQVLGEPDTFLYGESTAAWSPLAKNENGDNNIETLSVSFGSMVQATGVLIRETNVNGFVTQVDLKDQPSKHDHLLATFRLFNSRAVATCGFLLS